MMASILLFLLLTFWHFKFYSFFLFSPLEPTLPKRNQTNNHRSSINAQKHSDEYTRPNLFTHLYYLQVEPRQAAYNVYSNMNSYFKGREGGAASSFSTVNFYNKQAKNKRDALVERYNAEAALEAHSPQQ